MFFLKFLSIKGRVEYIGKLIIYVTKILVAICTFCTFTLSVAILDLFNVIF